MLNKANVRLARATLIGLVPGVLFILLVSAIPSIIIRRLDVVFYFPFIAVAIAGGIPGLMVILEGLCERRRVILVLRAAAIGEVTGAIMWMITLIPVSILSIPSSTPNLADQIMGVALLPCWAAVTGFIMAFALMTARKACQVSQSSTAKELYIGGAMGGLISSAISMLIIRVFSPNEMMMSFAIVCPFGLCVSIGLAIAELRAESRMQREHLASAR